MLVFSFDGQKMKSVNASDSNNRNNSRKNKTRNKYQYDEETDTLQSNIPCQKRNGCGDDCMESKQSCLVQGIKLVELDDL